jgi:ribonuclease PH
MSDSPRPDGRRPDQLRPISFSTEIAPHADGSVLISFGKTRVICAACVEENVPRWMRQQKVAGGWVTAEYSMLPYSTLERKQRDISRGRLDGRSSEIQRLVGRALRSVVDLKKIGQRTIWVDCDVLQADGGTRTAAVTGGCVALAIALNRLMGAGKLKEFPMKQLVAAISAGVVGGRPVLDLDYPEDSEAGVDGNFIMTGSKRLIEVQMSAEGATFSRDQMDTLLDLAEQGVETLVAKQREATGA